MIDTLLTDTAQVAAEAAAAGIPWWGILIMVIVFLLIIIFIGCPFLGIDAAGAIGDMFGDIDLD